MKKRISKFSVFCLLLTLLTGAVTVFAESGGYEIQVTDEEGSPVSGAMVQFCSDTECMMQKTDDAGLARFDQPAGSYTVHILKVPEGFAPDSTEYSAPETPGLMTITLAKEGAEEPEETADNEDVMDYPEIGFHFETPEKYKDLKGSIQWGASYPADGVMEITTEYYSVPKDQFEAYAGYAEEYINAVMDGKEAPEAPDPSWMSGHEYGWLFNVYAINDGRGESELREIIRNSGINGDDFAWLEEIGKDGDNTFFAGQFAQPEEEKEEYQKIMGDCYDEYVSLYSDKETFLSALTMSAPEWPQRMKPGEVISFETTDLEGNPVSGKDIFAGHKVTMINLWATWCGPCKQELPELAQMAEEFAAQDCQIIGICHDSAEEGKTEEAKAILEEAGVDYLNLAAPEDVDDIFKNTAFPTSYFVDSEGKLLVDPIEGAYLEKYSEALQEALSLTE